MFAPAGSALQQAWQEHIEQLRTRAGGVRAAFQKIYDRRGKAVSR